MLIVRVLGGLGNQMFQCAMGVAISTMHNYDLRFDLEWFSKTNAHQGYELKRVFGIQVPEASGKDIWKVLGWRGHPCLRVHMGRNALRILRPLNFISQPVTYSDSFFQSLPDNVYLNGYWQSEKYFSNIEDVLLKNLKFKPHLTSCNQKIADEISSSESVSIHIRRGDYISNFHYNKVHGVNLEKYYNNAIIKISELVRVDKFYVFSDDPGWVHKNINFSFPWKCVDHNREAESYNDMRLMSMCKHNIIANSSFSWWGGWLNKNPHKIVIAPAQWFNNTSSRPSDLYCSKWIIL